MTEGTTMTIRVLRFAAVAALALPLLSSAQSTGLSAADVQALVRSLPQGAEFKSSGQTYRPVEGLRAALRGPDGAAQRVVALGGSAADVVAEKGPYVVYRNTGAAPSASGATPLVNQVAICAVVVNTRTGQLGIADGLLTAKLSDVGAAREIAAANGLALDFVADGIGYAFFRVPAGRDLAAAAAAVAGDTRVKSAEVDVRESFAQAQQAGEAHGWSYQGEHAPAHWGDLEPQYRSCKVGQLQSPIDIRGAKPARLPAIDFAYGSSPLRIVDNGHTVQVTPVPGSYITLGGVRHDLLQVHFHHPAEEQVGGKGFPMVAHLVHKDAEGRLAVVAVLLEEGAANPFIEKVWMHLPAKEGREDDPAGVSVDLAGLLPASRGYYTFAGSLTTPPCSEGVTWFVLKTSVTVSPAAVAAFAKRYPDNARPLQPLNGRVIQVSE
jgi:carbonic anhydrase